MYSIFIDSYRQLFPASRVYSQRISAIWQISRLYEKSSAMVISGQLVTKKQAGRCEINNELFSFLLLSLFHFHVCSCIKLELI